MKTDCSTAQTASFVRPKVGGGLAGVAPKMGDATCQNWPERPPFTRFLEN
jgi:hypothetical protein